MPSIPDRPTPVNRGKPPSVSYDAIKWVFSLDQGSLTHVEFRVLMCLARHHNGSTGLSFPSRATLAEECGMVPTNISHTLKRLEERGFVRISRSGKRGRNAAPSNQYSLNLTADEVYSLHPIGVTITPHNPEPLSGNEVYSLHPNKENTLSLTTVDRGRGYACPECGSTWRVIPHRGDTPVHMECNGPDHHKSPYVPPSVGEERAAYVA